MPADSSETVSAPARIALNTNPLLMAGRQQTIRDIQASVWCMSPAVPYNSFPRFGAARRKPSGQVHVFAKSVKYIRWK